MIALVPAAPANAQTSANGTITITPTSGTPSYACIDAGEDICSFTTTVTVTGSGFPSGQNNIDLCFLPSSDTPAASCPTGGIDLALSGSLFDQTIAGTAADTVQADANGNFKVQFYAPIAYGGTYDVYAFYTPGSGVPVYSTVQTFTLKPGMAIEDETTQTNSGIPGQPYDVIIVGMGSVSPPSGAGEAIQLIPDSFFTGTYTGLTVGHVLGVDQGVFEEDAGAVVTGAGVIAMGADLPALASGTVSVEALGLTSGTTVTATFTTTPSILLTMYANPCAAPAPANYLLSTATAAGNKLCLSGYGFAKSSTIAAAGTVTIGGQTTIESAITTSSTGSFGPVPVTLSNSVGVGPLTVSFDGMSFNFTAGNIEGYGILLGSNVGQGALTYLSETSGHVGDTVDMFGFGYSAAIAPAFAFGTTDALATALTLTQIAAEDGNGAFGYSFAVPADPATTPACVAGTGGAICYIVHDKTVSANTAPDQTFTIMPEATFTTGPVTTGFLNAAGTNVANTFLTATAVAANAYKGDYLAFANGPDGGESELITASTAAIAGGVVTLTTTAFTVTPTTIGDSFAINPLPGSTVGLDNSFGFAQDLTVSGYATTDPTLTLTMNGVTWTTLAVNPALDGGVWTYTLPAIGTTPSIDFPGGSYTLNATGTTTGNWAVTTNTLTILPIQAESQGVGALPRISALSINTGNAGQSVALLSSPNGGLHGLAPSTAYTIMWDGTTNVGSFTSTAAGEVPVGASFVVPSGTSGLHIVDIQTAGVSAIYGLQLTGGQQFGGILALGPPVTYDDLIFNLLPLLTATPSLVGSGQTATVVGSGLPASTSLYVVAPNSVSYASFTSTSTGGVPSGITFTVPQMTTGTPSVACPVAPFCGGERGTLESWNIENAQSNVVGLLQFVYGAVATVSSDSGAAGTSVTITVNGLNAPTSPDSPYGIIFNCIPNNNVPFTCTGIASGPTPGNIAIGALIPNTLGSASTTITIPTGATSGTYTIQVVTAGGGWALANPVTFTVGAPSGVGVNTLTPGAPTQTTLEGNTAVSLSYTNTLSTSITIIGYAVVTNALGQTVAYTTASATLSAMGSQTLYFVLAGLPTGTYSVTAFAISSTNVVVSPNTSATATVS